MSVRYIYPRRIPLATKRNGVVGSNCAIWSVPIGLWLCRIKLQSVENGRDMDPSPLIADDSIG